MAGNASGNVIVTIDHVEKIYQGRSGEVVALNGVDMEIGENEFVCVVGPSGCGKSTLLNIIAGLEKPTSGRGGKSGKRARCYLSAVCAVSMADCKKECEIRIEVKRGEGAGTVCNCR